MNPLSRNYLKTQVETASKPQLLIMLFDGAIRFTDRARVEIEARQFESSFNLLVRAQRIMVELMSALDAKQVPPDLHRNLTSLYAFVYRRLVAANIERSVAPCDEALQILRHLRETWLLAIEKMDPEVRKQSVSGTVATGEPRSLSVRG